MVLVLLWRPQGSIRWQGDEARSAPSSSTRLAAQRPALLARPARAARRHPAASCSSRRSCSPAQRSLNGGEDLRLHRAGRELRPAARLHRHRLLRPHHVLRHRRLRHRHRARARADLDAHRWAWLIALSLGSLLALVIGLLSLRVRAIFFAMITLAVASAFPILASQLSTHRRRGRPVLPACRSCCGPAFRLLGAGPRRLVNGRSSPITSSSSARWRSSSLLLRIVNSPFGRVLQAIRENEFRAEALGYRRRLPHRGQLPRRGGRWPARSRRSGCATPGRTPRSPSRS